MTFRRFFTASLYACELRFCSSNFDKLWPNLRVPIAEVSSSNWHVFLNYSIQAVNSCQEVPCLALKLPELFLLFLEQPYKGCSKYQIPLRAFCKPPLSRDSDITCNLKLLSNKSSKIILSIRVFSNTRLNLSFFTPCPIM